MGLVSWVFLFFLHTLFNVPTFLRLLHLYIFFVSIRILLPITIQDPFLRRNIRTALRKMYNNVVQLQ